MNSNINKLVTKEDPNYIHKLLAMISLFNYTYRYYLLFLYGTMFLNTPLDLLIIALHGCLSLSSLIFHIPKKRHAKLPMIYPEFRLHSIAFGMRSVICCFVDYYTGYYKLYYKMGVCIGTMMIADWITKHYSQPGDTTMRAMPYSETTFDKDRQQITRFHSNQQVTATLFMLMNIDSAFSPLFAIQIAAFLMTLVRKSIIQPNTWHLLYSWALMLNIFVLNTMSIYQIFIMFLGTHGFRKLRMKKEMNKYLGWAIIFGMITVLELIQANTSYYMLDDTYKKFIYHILCLFYISVNIYNTRGLYSLSLTSLSSASLSSASLSSASLS
jgi:hypothetical protein